MTHQIKVTVIDKKNTSQNCNLKVVQNGHDTQVKMTF